MDSLVATLTAWLEPIQELLAAFVFGSRARGRPRADSDLDVAVLAASTDPGVRLRLLKEVSVALADLAPEGRVDVVFLDEAHDVLAHQIFSKGILLFCKDRRKLLDLHVRTLREHGDREPYRRHLNHALIRRLAEDSGHRRQGTAVESLVRTGQLPRRAPELPSPGP